MEKRKNTKQIIAAFILVCTLAVAFVISGSTLAWLTDKTEPVKNTFATSDINIELTETFNKDTDNDGKPDTWEKKMIPGYSLSKDPKVTVVVGSEACWLFVKIEESAYGEKTVAFNEYMEYTVAAGWTQGDGTNIPANVWYRKVTSEEVQAGASYYVLAGDGIENSEFQNGRVTVKDTVTKEMMIAAEGKEPTLTFTAYASQLMKDNTTAFTEVEAWGNVPKE